MCGGYEEVGVEGDTGREGEFWGRGRNLVLKEML